LSQRGYTPNSKLASLTDANNNTTTFTYDGLDRLSLTSYPLGTTQALTYDADSNILTQTTRAGEQVTFTYDTLNRVSGKTATASGRSYAYVYSLINQPTSMTSPEGTWTFAYDNLRRMTTRGFPAINGQAMSVSFGYDPVGTLCVRTVRSAIFTPVDLAPSHPKVASAGARLVNRWLDGRPPPMRSAPRIICTACNRERSRRTGPPHERPHLRARAVP